MSKHTPGPWYVDSDGDVYVPARGLLATDFYMAQPTNIADAYLIAAAPDLLEACKAAFAIVDEWSDAEPDRGSHNHDEVWRKLRLAIAKAEGK